MSQNYYRRHDDIRSLCHETAFGINGFLCACVCDRLRSRDQDNGKAT